mmetsp:Transcript_9153/g.22470  ORF Transcript_9153/g.22470 Transcript_9153/m.22470 type:complete len:335 (-) Transcript_9153:228-1232(-)
MRGDLFLLLPLAVAAVSAGVSGGGEPLRVLFIGNSFTFVNDLPGQFANIARSLGRDVHIDNSTIGGCTLYRQTPSRDDRTAMLLKDDWDYIVLQDYSLLPTVKNAREKYLKPALKEFLGSKRDAKIVLYLTWGYDKGLTIDCPTSDTGDCFPLGTLADLTDPSCKSTKDYRHLVGSFECMGYAVARGYLDAMESFSDGIFGVVPCGLAWQVVRGSKAIPEDCKESIDNEYGSPIEGNITIPLQIDNGTLPDFQMYRVYPDGNVDKHPNIAGQYLNALVFYTMLFQSSPVGAARPLITEHNFGDKNLTDVEILTLQEVATRVVLDHLDAWHPHAA